MHISNLNAGSLTIRIGDQETSETHAACANRHQPLIEDFASAVLAGHEPTVGGDVGLEVNRILERIYRG